MEEVIDIGSPAQLPKTHAYDFFYGFNPCCIWPFSFPAGLACPGIIIFFKEP